MGTWHARLSRLAQPAKDSQSAALGNPAQNGKTPGSLCREPDHTKPNQSKIEWRMVNSCHWVLA